MPVTARGASRLVRYAGRIGRAMLTGRWNRGRCSICEKSTIFVEVDAWLRDGYLCARCRSIPRARALLSVLTAEFPDWRNLSIHESSPGGPGSQKLARDAPGYSSSQFFPDVAPGAVHRGVRCQNLERLTFSDGAFDLFVTQDVLEHVLRPDRVLAEITRVLKPGGAHVFTVPVFWGRDTLVRAVPDGSGGIHHLMQADYHANPVSDQGSLVIREWGDDIVDYVAQHTGSSPKVLWLKDRDQGLDGEFLQVFVSRKPG